MVVPEGLEVVVDSRFESPLYWLRADGTVSFDTTTNTRLTVETLVVSPTGSLVMGTNDNPIAEGVSARLVFSDSGPLSFGFDPTLVSRGLISFGTVSIVGTEVTGYAPITGATAGSSTFTLQSFVTGWKPGDRLVLPGLDPTRTTDDEERTILSIADDLVTIDAPLKFNHTSNDGSFDSLAANVSRNAILESQIVDNNNRRGHVLLTGSSEVNIANAGFYGLGRTDKRKDFTESLDPTSSADADSLNINNRHALYIVDRGTDSTNVTGSAVVDSPGFGVAIARSSVNVQFNVAFDVAGAAFMVEDATSSGTLRDNLAIKSEGSKLGIDKRALSGDFGHSGHGFFVMSALMDFSGNTAWSQRAAGIVLYLPGVTQSFTTFADNNTYFSSGGLEVHRYTPSTGTTLTRFDAIGNRARAVSLVASGNLVFEGGLLQATAQASTAGKLTGEGFVTDSKSTGVRLANLDIRNFETGFLAPQLGASALDGVTFSNVVNIHIKRALEDGRSLLIDDTVVFQTAAGKTERTPYHVFIDLTVQPEKGDIASVFDPKSAWIGNIQRQLTSGESLRYYLAELAHDYVPFASGDSPTTTPQAFLDKTNAELLAEFGLTTGGVIAPEDAITDELGNALVSSSAPTLAPRLQQLSPRYTSNPTKYRLSYRDLDGKRVTEKTTPLVAGWNVLTRDVAGVKVSFMVFADVQTPAFQLTTPLRINPVDLARGIKIAGAITDDSFGTMKFSKHLKDLDKLPQTVGEEGLPVVSPSFTVKDRAGNSLLVNVTVTIDPNAPLQKQTKLNLANRKLSATLLALLDSTSAPLFSQLTLGQVNSLSQAMSTGESLLGGSADITKTLSTAASHASKEISKETSKLVSKIF